MLNDITVGQYYPTDSILHRLDVRSKLFATLVLITGLFVASDFASLAVCAAFIVFAILLSRVPPLVIVRGYRFVIIILGFTFLLNLFMYGGETLLKIGSLRITDRGVYMGAFLFLRISLLIIGSSILTFTSKPLDLTAGFESVLRPLRRLRFPSGEVAMVMGIALRFIPILIIEFNMVMKAQGSRGVNFSEGGPIKRGKALLAIFIPLLARSFKIADNLAHAMEARCYVTGAERSKYKPPKFAARDAWAAAVMLSYLAVVVCARMFLP
jgi:energy-coupling factor transport system permease protein